MSKACTSCKYGHITLHSRQDKCSHPDNVKGYHPYALRHDATLCGEAATWHEDKPAREATYKAA
jgi:hypothetical protein